MNNTVSSVDKDVFGDLFCCVHRASWRQVSSMRAAVSRNTQEG